MAQRRDTQKQTQRKNNKKNTKIGAIVWGIVLAVVLAAAVFFASNYHQDIKQRVQNAQYPLSYSEYVEKYAKEFDLDPALVYAVMRTESSFNPEAESPAGAYGLDADNRRHARPVYEHARRGRQIHRGGSV